MKSESKNRKSDTNFVDTEMPPGTVPESLFLLILITLFSAGTIALLLFSPTMITVWEEIRQATQRGRLMGQAKFQKQVEAMTRRR